MLSLGFLSLLLLLTPPEAWTGPGREPHPGELVVSELLVDPQAVPDHRGEFVEVVNVADDPLQLFGLVLRDHHRDWCVVERPLVLAAGGRLVFARHLDPHANGGIFPAYPCPGHSLHLNNDRDDVVLDWYGVVLDEVSYQAKPWQLQPGVAMTLLPGVLDAQANDRPEAWQPVSDPMPGGDRGSPGW